tara:strand:- start:5034 stop:5219 length:186 start_codon:yes stop_codon:yes gene_type:complete
MTRVSWLWRGKRYYGTLIPSRETKDNRYARTENGKIKTLPKTQTKTKAKAQAKQPTKKKSY